MEFAFIVEEISIDGDRESAEVEVMLDKINSLWTYKNIQTFKINIILTIALFMVTNCYYNRIQYTMI